MAMESVRPAGAGPWLEKTRPEAARGWKSVAVAAPVCGETPTADFAIASLVRTREVMSSRAWLWFGGGGAAARMNASSRS